MMFVEKPRELLLVMGAIWIFWIYIDTYRYYISISISYYIQIYIYIYIVHPWLCPSLATCLFPPHVSQSPQYFRLALPNCLGKVNGSLQRCMKVMNRLKATQIQWLHPWCLTWNLKISPWKREVSFEKPSFFRFHINLWCLKMFGEKFLLILVIRFFFKSRFMMFKIF